MTTIIEDEDYQVPYFQGMTYKRLIVSSVEHSPRTVAKAFLELYGHSATYKWSRVATRDGAVVVSFTGRSTKSMVFRNMDDGDMEIYGQFSSFVNYDEWVKKIEEKERDFVFEGGQAVMQI